MAEILKYKLPEKEVITKTGFFRLKEQVKDVSGFIVTTFQKEQVYQFYELPDLQGKFYFNTEKPYITSEAEYIEEAQEFIDALPRNEIQKAVFSRVKAVSFDERKTTALFEALCEAYPKAFVYLISSELFGTWIGATPEILLQTINQTGFTIALAGTLPTETSSTWQEKEKIEQQLVTDYIQEKLEEFPVTELSVQGPYTYHAGPVQHLRTDFSFDLPQEKALDLALNLHPTPAVSGLPQKKAIELIHFKEPHERELYTGLIGEVSDAKSALFVNLRCCQIQKGSAYLYLGGGFTKDSNPQAEWQETENKSHTLLNVMNGI